MNTTTLARHYGKPTPVERFSLVVAAVFSDISLARA